MYNREPNMTASGAIGPSPATILLIGERTDEPGEGKMVTGEPTNGFRDAIFLPGGYKSHLGGFPRPAGGYKSALGGNKSAAGGTTGAPGGNKSVLGGNIFNRGLRR
jgi:hypothetical protein